MIKYSLSILFTILVSFNAYSQISTISITAGSKIAGSFTKKDKDLANDFSGSRINETQKVSFFDARSFSITYGFKVSPKLKAILGFRQNDKGYKINYMENGIDQKVLSTNILVRHNGILFGVEKSFYKKKNVQLSWSILANPEWFSLDDGTKNYHNNLSVIVNFNADIKLYKFLSLRFNPFGEMGLTSYKELITLSNVEKHRVYGLGCQAGLNFDF